MTTWDPQDRHTENRALLDRARGGDIDAQWQLIVNYEPRVRSTVRQVIDDSSVRTDRQELIDLTTRDAVVLIRSSFDGFAGEYPQFSRWLTTIAHRHAIRAVKGHKRESAVIDSGAELDGASEVPSPAELFEAGLDATARARLVRALRSCLDEMDRRSPELAELVRLRYRQRLTHERIRNHLAERGDHVGVDAVRKRIDKSLVGLGRCIKATVADG